MMAGTTANNRRLLLYAMLASLALAAAAGVLGVLSPGQEVIWRLVGTAFLTSIACALLLAASRFIEKPQMRFSSIAGMSLVVVEYLLGLLLVWEVVFSNYVSESIGLSMLAIAGAGIPIVVMLRVMMKPDGRLAAIAGLVLLGLSLLTMLAGAWVRGGFSSDFELMGCGWFVELYSFPIIACLIGFGEKRYWRWIGIIASAIACFLICYAIIAHIDDHAPAAFAWATIVAIFFAHANLSLRANLTPGQAWLRWATIAAAGGTGVMVGMLASKGSNSSDDFLVRAAAAGGICAGCGSMAMAILARMNRKVEREMVAPTEITEMAITCPGCKKSQTVPLGESACGGCGLRFSIKVDEPRCETCGYLLYHLKSGRCPECGTAIGSSLPSTKGALE
jgi:hypothetical protein